MKILLAEDSASLNRAITAMLKSDHYEVESVFDGEQAIRQLNENGYDVIILDIMMPKMNGFEVLSELRRQHNLTPVLMLTALSGIEDRVKGLESGADDYLAKPFAMKELLARVHALCRRKGDYDLEELHYADLSLNPIKMEISAVNAVRVSARECALLHLLLANRDKCLGVQYLLGSIWSDVPDPEEDVVSLYISYLRNKLVYINAHVRIIGNIETGFQLTAKG